MKNYHKVFLINLILIITLLACGLANTTSRDDSRSPTPTIVVAQFSTSVPPTHTSAPEPTATSQPPTPIPPSPTPLSSAEEEAAEQPSVESEITAPTPIDVPPTETPTTEAPPTTSAPEPPPTATPAPAAAAPAANTDFVVRFVRLRTNEENSWDGVLGEGLCGSDHSIYVHVADANENLLDGILIGDKFGNFEVPTGIDGQGAVRILVWSATMELSIVGHEDGTRYTSEFTPPLSTLDEDISIAWLEEAGYCSSIEDCQQRVATNQLCRGHYSYDVIFQRTW